MTSDRPERIAIDCDDDHAEHVGRTKDGRQFFLTTPFRAALGEEPGCEHVALFVFDRAGAILEARIDSFGPRSGMDADARRRCYEQRLLELGEITFCRIEVKPFFVERFGTRFGLIPREPEDPDDEWTVELEPGNYMAFFAPWDSGVYDT